MKSPNPKVVCAFAAFTILHINPAKGQAAAAASFSTQQNTDISISFLVPKNWFFGTLVPESPNPKNNFTRIDVFIASGMPPIERSNISEPIAVHISKILPKMPDKQKSPNLLSTYLAKENIVPIHQTLNGFTFSKYGPCITKSNPRLAYQIVITDSRNEIYCVISTSADIAKQEHQQVLKVIADSIKPNLQ